MQLVTVRGMMNMAAKRNTQVTDNAHAARGAARADAAQRAAALEALLHRAETLEQAAHELHEQAKLARGTREIPLAPVVAPAVATPIAPAGKSPLYLEAERLLEEEPHTFRRLCTALHVTKENENGLKSVLVRIQRDGRPVVNLGNGARAIWWIDVHNRIGEIAGGRRGMSGRK